MRSSISIVLILFLFSSPSPKDQNAEDPKPEEEDNSVDNIPDTGTETVLRVRQQEEEVVTTTSTTTTPTSTFLGHEPVVQVTAAQEELEGADDLLKDQENQEKNVPVTEAMPVSGSEVVETIGDTAHTPEGIAPLLSSSSDTISPVTEEVSKPGEEQRNKTPVPADVNKSEDSIPSFSEWTRLQLAQRKESIINSIKNKSSVVEGKNFASPDCGAKVINSNQEAQNPSGVISSSHDEYMLNRCTANVWFILELCEPLTIESLTLGNLELFSSNPHEFEVGVSDRYPTRDWIVFGPYFAPDSRNLHSFHLPPNNSTFGKYLRIVVKSSHGNEHYCPLSLIKVYGRSEYEVLESETTHAQDMDAEIPGIIEEEVIDDVPVEKSVLGTATAVVMNMVKKAADVLVNKKFDPKAEEERTDYQKEVEPTSPCMSLWQCLPESESKATIYQFLSCRRKELEFANQLLRWCGWDECHQFLEFNSLGSPWMSEAFLVAIYGPIIIPTICHFNHPLGMCQKTHENENLFLSGASNTTANISDGSGILQPPASTASDAFGEEEEQAEGKGNRRPATNSDSSDSETQPENGSAQNFQFPTPPPPVEEPAQKESVFVRLSNRIKALERNQSLSSGYLEELSQRFKRQSEEMHATHEVFRKSLNDSWSKCAYLESTLRYEVRKLNRNLDTLRDVIWRLEFQRSGFFILSLLQILSTIFLWWNGRRGTKSSHTVFTPAEQEPACEDSVFTDCNQLPSLRLNQRKRSCSQQTKQKKKKKRREVGSLEDTKPVEITVEVPKRIPSSLSTGSIPLGLPAESPTTPAEFEFATPMQIHARSNGGHFKQPVQYLATVPVTNSSLSPVQVSSTNSPAERSSSELSESSSTKSHKKRSKFKSFFFGK